jgi:hypothetical protein
MAAGCLSLDPAPGGRGGHQDQDRQSRFRVTGITAYLKNKGLLEQAQTIANHAPPRTTKLYDRGSGEISLDESRGDRNQKMIYRPGTGWHNDMRQIG